MIGWSNKRNRKGIWEKGQKKKVKKRKKGDEG
jgi:hypothetical protein